MSSKVEVTPVGPKKRFNEITHKGLYARLFEQEVGTGQQLHLTIKEPETDNESGANWRVTIEQQNRGGSVNNKTLMSIDKRMVSPEGYKKIEHHINTRPDIPSHHYERVIERTDGNISSMVGDYKSIGPDVIDCVLTVRSILSADQGRYAQSISAIDGLLAEIDASQH